jgi:hypothetical protein
LATSVCFDLTADKGEKFIHGMKNGGGNEIMGDKCLSST